MVAWLIPDRDANCRCDMRRERSWTRSHSPKGRRAGASSLDPASAGIREVLAARWRRGPAVRPSVRFRAMTDLAPGVCGQHDDGLSCNSLHGSDGGRYSCPSACVGACRREPLKADRPVARKTGADTINRLRAGVPLRCLDLRAARPAPGIWWSGREAGRSPGNDEYPGRLPRGFPPPLAWLTGRGRIGRATD